MNRRDLLLGQRAARHRLRHRVRVAALLRPSPLRPVLAACLLGLGRRPWPKEDCELTTRRNPTEACDCGLKKKDSLPTSMAMSLSNRSLGKYRPSILPT